MATKRKSKTDPTAPVLQVLQQLRAEPDFALEEIYAMRMEMRGGDNHPGPPRPRLQVISGGGKQKRKK